MKPTVLCKLTPDAVALLQLINARSIGFEKMGELINGDEPRVTNGNGAKAARKEEHHRKLRADAGRTTINGITVRSWRKGGKNMSKNAVLTTGQDAPSKKANGQLLDSFKAVQGAMTRDETLGLPTITRLTATGVVAKKNAGKSRGYISGQISYLFKYGYLREVVSRSPA